MAALRRRPLDLALPWLVAATVVAFACGSSSVAVVTRAGRDARWVLLGLLLLAAAARAVPARRLFPAAPPAAIALVLVGVALVSAAWSVTPRTSVERAVTLAVLFVTALALAAAEERPARLLAGLVGGAAIVAAAGFVVLAADHGAAVQAASLQSPARYRGLGQDANTAGLLFALALPLAIAPATVSKARARLAFLAASALFVGSIVASGSRGALFAGGIGALVAVTASRGSVRRAIVPAAAVVALVGAGLVVQNLPKAALNPSAPTPTTAAASVTPRHGYINAEAAYPLSADVGAPLPGGGQPPVTRGFFGGSGRVDAWIGALHQILQRPLLGFGFGTESAVFVDRYYYFVGGSPEDSFLGISLQLGFVGLAVLLALFLALAGYARRAVVRSGAVAAACAGAVAAGLVLAVVQSYVYSVGDIGTVTLWMCAFMLPRLAQETRNA